MHDYRILHKDENQRGEKAYARGLLQHIRNFRNARLQQSALLFTRIQTTGEYVAERIYPFRQGIGKEDVALKTTSFYKFNAA